MGNYNSKDELVLDGNVLIYFLTAHAEFSKEQDNLKDSKILQLETDDDYRIE